MVNLFSFWKSGSCIISIHLIRILFLKDVLLIFKLDVYFAIGLLDFPHKNCVRNNSSEPGNNPRWNQGHGLDGVYRGTSAEMIRFGKDGQVTWLTLGDRFEYFLIIKEMIQFASNLSTWVEEKNPPTWYVYIYMKQKQEIPSFSNESSSVWMLNFRGV